MSVKTIASSTGVSLKESTVDLVDRVIVVWLDTDEDEIGVHVVYDASIETFLSDSAAPYRGSLRLGLAAMTFPARPASVDKFEVGDVIATHKEGKVVTRKHASGSFTALIDGEPKPARQYLIGMRVAMGLPRKVNDTTRSLGSQVFGNFETGSPDPRKRL